ncbi:MAG: heavy metal translocating P-type ATPase [Eubacteriales bacterium]
MADMDRKKLNPVAGHEEHCGCGCEHEHDHDHEHHHEHEEHAHQHHDHDEGCGCGCGHNHGHEEHEHHHHEHSDSCGCGHDHGHEEHEHHHHEHDDSCGCGHNHGHEEHEHHHHEHGDSCGCGHNHGHEEHEHHHHKHGDSCGCGHEHHHHEHHHEHSAAARKEVYIIENLGCAHCASKMEEKINALPGVEEATITFATRQLRVLAADPDALLPEMQRICSSIESEVKIVPKTVNASAKTKVYIINGLDCAHCAAKVEERINEVPGVENAVLTYATRQLRITAENPDALIDEIRRVSAALEEGVTIVERDPSPKSAAKNAAAQSAREEEKKNERRELISIIIGAVLFVVGEILSHMGAAAMVTLPIFVIGYLILGAGVLVTAARNISHGQIFDENFLMGIATLGAFAIGMYPEAMGVMLFYRIGEFFEHKAVERSRGQIMDAVDMRPEVVNLIQGDDIKVIPAENAKVGDVLMIRPGDRIPLDGIILEGESRLDTSPITGEPVPVAVKAGDDITSGCVNTSGQLKIRVEKPLSESMVTRILDSVENAAASKPKIDRFITRFSKVYTPIVVTLALVTAIIPSLVTGNWHQWIYTAITFLVMSCPCALVLSVPLAFFSGIGAGSKKGILFKGGVAMEALSNLGAVVMDKTGTVTEGNFKLQKIVSTGSISEDELLRICASCEQFSTHPIAASIVAAAQEKGVALEKPAFLEEIAGHGISASLAAGKVLCGNQKLMDENQVAMNASIDTGYGSEVFLAVDGKLAGYLVISDTLKADAKSAIARLKKMGLRTVMLTGDAQESADAVAKMAGIDEVHAKLLPQDKLSIMAKLREQNGNIMFVGDGINDAPVLAGADVGAAMGSGADAAIEAADAVFMTSSMESVPTAISIARSTNHIAVQNVVFALIIKIAVMILGLAGHPNMWLAVFADTGVAMLCVLNSIRILYKK